MLPSRGPGGASVMQAAWCCGLQGMWAWAGLEGEAKTEEGDHVFFPEISTFLSRGGVI